MVWQKTKADQSRRKVSSNIIDDTEGSDYIPLNKGHFTLPGRGNKPGYCRRKKVAGFKPIEGRNKAVKDIALVFHWITCNKAECPECYRIWLYTSLFHNLTKIYAYLIMNPSMKVWSGFFSLRDNCKKDITKTDLDEFRTANNKILKKKKIDTALKFLHMLKIKPGIKNRINSHYFKDNRNVPSRSKLYRLASDLDYLNKAGADCETWRDAFDMHPHEQMLLFSEEAPDFSGENHPKIRMKVYGRTSNSLAGDNNEGVGNETFLTKLKSKKNGNIRPIETREELAHAVLYNLDHAGIVINTKNRNILTVIPIGGLRKIKEIKESHPEVWAEAETAAMRAMRSIGLHFKILGDKVYPMNPDGTDDVPNVDETKEPTYPMEQDYIPISEFAVRYGVNKTGKHFETANTVKDQELIMQFLVTVKEIDEKNPLPCMNRVDLFRDIITQYNISLSDESIPHSQKGVFMDQIKLFDYYVSVGGQFIDNGFVSKKRFLSIPDRRDTNATDNASNSGSFRGNDDGYGYPGFDAYGNYWYTWYGVYEKKRDWKSASECT